MTFGACKFGQEISFLNICQTAKEKRRQDFYRIGFKQKSYSLLLFLSLIVQKIDVE